MAELRHTVYEHGQTVAAFLDIRDARTWAARPLNPTPQPKFKVGDRVQIAGTRRVPTVMTVTDCVHCYRCNGDADHWIEDELELAPPEPRATVKQYGDMWRVDCGVALRNFLSQEEAEYIAAGLNEHHDWRL